LKQSSMLEKRVAELEEELDRAATEKDHHTRHHSVMQKRNSELQDQLTDAQDRHSKHRSSLQNRVSELESQLNEASANRALASDQEQLVQALQGETGRLSSEVTS